MLIPWFVDFIYLRLRFWVSAPDVEDGANFRISFLIHFLKMANAFINGVMLIIRENDFSYSSKKNAEPNMDDNNNRPIILYAKCFTGFILPYSWCIR